MITSTPTTRKCELSEVGITFQEDVSLEEWTELGRSIARAGRSLGFIIGDWINYGVARKDYGTKYTEALKATGMDYCTLKSFSRVARRIDRVRRITHLSFEHHSKVSMLESAEQERWLKIADEAARRGEPISARRLAKSILLGRVARESDMLMPGNDRGFDNIHPHVNRLVAFWNKMKRSGFLDNADTEEIKIMLDDLGPVLGIARELQQALTRRGGGSPRKR